MESSACFIFINMVLKTAFGVNYNAVMILTMKLCSCKMTVERGSIQGTYFYTYIVDIDLTVVLT